jgi:hypothetical protein
MGDVELGREASSAQPYHRGRFHQKYVVDDLRTEIPLLEVTEDATDLAIRDAIAKASGNDLQKMAEAARSRQKASGRQSAKLLPKRARTAKNAS